MRFPNKNGKFSIKILRLVEKKNTISCNNENTDVNSYSIIEELQFYFLENKF